MRQVKAYVEVHPYEELTGPAGAERTVSSYFVTNIASALAARLIADLAAPRPVTNDAGAAALQVVAGQRGAGKSHFLAFLRAVIGQRQLRALVHDSGLLQALQQLSDRTPIVVEINFAGHEREPFVTRLRAALAGVTGGALSFTDEQWAHAVAHEQVFEQALRALPLDAQLILFVDNLPRRWEVAPEQTPDDLDWLALIARQSAALPLRAVVARDEDAPADGVTGTVYHLPPGHLREVVARHILRKTPQQVAALGELYDELCANLPGFAWPREEFAACYPIHPLIFDLAPTLRALTRKFSLPSFAASAAARVLNHPAISPVVLDELFDRYEYELRKNPSLAPAFTAYDRIIAEGVMKLPVMERLWAKLVAKAVLLLAVAGRAITPRAVVEAQFLFESGGAETTEQRVARVLTHFAASCPALFSADGQQGYTLTPPRPEAELETQLAEAAEKLSAAEPQTAARLSELLLAAGGRFFADWKLCARDGESRDDAPCFNQTCEVAWRGGVRTVELIVCSPTPDESDSGANAQEWRGEMHVRRIEVLPLLPQPSAEMLPGAGVSVRWQPGAIADEAMIAPLKMLLALEALSAETGGVGDAREKLRERLEAQARELFAELYLSRGTFVEHLNGQRKVRALSAPPAGEAPTLATFLATEMSATFAQVFPSHPDFPAPLEAEQVQRLVTALFAQAGEKSAPDAALEELAAHYAAPLGLVSRPDDERGAARHRLDIFRGTNTPHPLIQAVLNFADGQAEQSGLANIPLSDVMKFLGRAPYGLTPPYAHLIVGALTAVGLIELVNEATGEMLAAGNVHEGFAPERYTALRRVTSADYPQEVLAEWARQLTGQSDLPPPINREAEARLRAALSEWLARWEPEQWGRRFEQMPIEMFTVGHWRAMHASRQRIARVHALAGAAVRGQTPLTTALSRVADVFGFDLDLLAVTQAEMRALGSFLDWVPTLAAMRNYVLAAEPTGQAEIEQLRSELTETVQSSHRLIDPERRAEAAAKFAEFRRRYSDFYAAAHESHVGPSASRELIKSFCDSADWQQFCLLLHLRLDDGAFHRDTQALLTLTCETRCELPVRELLEQQPHCCCSFRLHRRMHLGSLLDALKAVVSAALTYYSLALWRRREEVRAQAVKLGDDRLTSEIEAFLSACGNGDLSLVTPELVRALNRCLADTLPETEAVRFVLGSALPCPL